jgi:hypothetical protein
MNYGTGRLNLVKFAEDFNHDMHSGGFTPKCIICGETIKDIWCSYNIMRDCLVFTANCHGSKDEVVIEDQSLLHNFNVKLTFFEKELAEKLAREQKLKRRYKHNKVIRKARVALKHNWRIA